MMMKNNYAEGCWRARAGTAGVLILGILLMGCDKDTQQQSDKTLAGPASKPAPPEEKPDRDWSQPYQLITIGDAVIRIPAGYIIRLDHGSLLHSLGAKEHMKLQTNIGLTTEGKPKFLTLDEARKFYDNRKGQARYVSPFDTYNTVFIDVNKVEYIFDKDAPVLGEQGVLKHYFGVDHPASPSILAGGLKGYSRVEHNIILADLGLKAHRHVTDVKENGVIIKSLVTKMIYFPLDTNFKKPDGSIFYLNCDETPVDPQAVKSCRVGFSPRDRVVVGYSFPPQYLRYWKEIHQFVLNSLQFTN